MRTASAAILVLTLSNTVAHAAVTYELTSRTEGASSAPITQRYWVQGDEIRVEGPANTTLMKGGTVYSIDTKAKTVTIVPGITLVNVEKTLREQSARAADFAANAPTDSQAQQTAQIVKQIAQPPQVKQDFQPTDRSEAVDGRSCRIWEESENGTKRLELCVVPAASLAGGDEILAGIKVMCQYVHGALFAIGVEYGRFDAWPGIQSLGGVPVRVREFKNGALSVTADRHREASVTEITLTAPQVIPPDAALMEVPAGYQVKALPGTTPRPPSQPN